LCLADVADYFLSELAKVFNEEDNLSKLSAFFILFRYCIPDASSRLKITTQNYFWLFNYQTSVKTKRAATFKFRLRNLRCRSKNKFEFFLKTL